MHYIWNTLDFALQGTSVFCSGWCDIMFLYVKTFWTTDHAQAIDSMNDLFLCGPRGHFFSTEHWDAMSAISHSVEQLFSSSTRSPWQSSVSNCQLGKVLRLHTQEDLCSRNLTRWIIVLRFFCQEFNSIKGELIVGVIVSSRVVPEVAVDPPGSRSRVLLVEDPTRHN